MNHNIHLVYMTAGTREEATTIGNALVQSKLAACVNIIENMHSIYEWDGELQHDAEVVLIAKTIAERVPQVVAKVSEMHSYECPCIVSLPVSDGNPAFLQWIVKGVGL